MASGRGHIGYFDYLFLFLYSWGWESEWAWLEFRLLVGRNDNVFLLLCSYSSIILVVTFKLATHTRFWSFCLIFSITILSLGPYAAYTWISNYYLSVNIVGTAYQAWTTGDTYFVVLFCICFVLFIDGVVVFIDFRRGGYASKMREVINAEQINNRFYYDKISLFITEGMTEQAKIWLMINDFCCFNWFILL